MSSYDVTNRCKYVTFEYEVVSFAKSDNRWKDEIVSVLEQLDEETRRNESTADMSRDLFVDDSKTVSDRRALEIFYEEVTDEVVIATVNSRVIGFSSVKKNDPFFEDGGSEYFPHIAVTYSGVLPEFRRQGVWTKMRHHIEEGIVVDIHDALH